MMKNRLSKMLSTLLLTLSLASCGFQLRGEQTLPFETFAINASGYQIVSNIRELVQKNIHQTKLIESTSTAQADATLNILNEEQEKVITALSATGRVREYELRLRVRFSLTDKNANQLIPPTEIKLFRILPYDESQVLSKGEEEVLLYKDMESDIAMQILRRVAAAKPL